MAAQQDEEILQAQSDIGEVGDDGDGDKKRKKKKRKDKDKKRNKKKDKEARAAEESGNGLGEVADDDGDARDERKSAKERVSKKLYEKEIERLNTELVKLQYWVKHKGLRIIVLFEGRDAAGKGGVIKTISAPLNPRGCRVVALGTPTEREKTQWYFQRYVEHLPAAGEIVLFDRSWYNRAGVERVMGFCSGDEYREFLQSCPEFERMLVRSGIILVKYWFSVCDEEQEQRFRERAETPTKRWKLSPMDLEARSRWVEFSKAKDAMFDHTDNSDAPWWVVNADDKRRARLNCITHLLSQIKYKDVLPKDPLKFPKRQDDSEYQRPPREKQRFVPEAY
jgi:polyphosphate kinase